MPPALEAMDDLLKNRKVTVSLSDMNNEESFTHRIFTLKSPNWSIDIGRGNSVEQGTMPGPDNAWFTSKVVSRHHATIKAHPQSMILTIEDANSMHGTYLNGTPVKREAMELLEDDIITFGTDIIRHSETFKPLRTRITYEWLEDSDSEDQLIPSRNRFTADYSDQEVFSDIDDEIEVVRESVRQPSVEIVRTGLTKPAMASSTTNSPSTSSVKSSTASSATTHIGIIVDELPELPAITKPSPAAAEFISKPVIDLVADDEESDMDDYPISPSEDFSLGDMHDSERETSVCAGEMNTNRIDDRSIPSTTEKLPREPSPSDAALPRPSFAPQPRVPAFSSLIPPPPPFPLSVPTNVSYSSAAGKYSPFVRDSWSSTSIPPSHQPSQSFTNQTPFGYDFTALNPPSQIQPSNICAFSPSQAPTWAYPSMHLPQPPSWIDHSYGTSENFSLPTKRKADEISVDSEESDLESIAEEPQRENELHLMSPVRQQSSSAFVPESLINGAAESVAEAAADVQDNAMIDTAIADVVDKETQASPSTVEVTQEVSASQTEPTERPRKRARTMANRSENGDSTIRTVAKFAATAGAGAVVGAVGVIIGLASLPPDYFA